MLYKTGYFSDLVHALGSNTKNRNSKIYGYKRNLKYYLKSILSCLDFSTFLSCSLQFVIQMSLFLVLSNKIQDSRCSASLYII